MMLNITLIDVAKSLQDYVDGMDVNLGGLQKNLKIIKELAVLDGNEILAKEIWCYENIVRTYTLYIESFQQMRKGSFYKAWCTLEEVEHTLLRLQGHFDINDERFQMDFINKQVSNFQSLYPYTAFLSPEIVALEKRCSICNVVVSLRTSCGHVTGEIYSGEMRGVVVTKLEAIGVSLVNNPVQKYSVVFTGNKGEDNYDYSLVENVVRRLGSPFGRWTPTWTVKLFPHSYFNHIGRNDKCPCGSGRKYKKCCLQKSEVSIEHCQVKFDAAPSVKLLSQRRNSIDIIPPKST